MTLPASGALTLSSLRSEYIGGSSAVSLSGLYSGLISPIGGSVPSTGDIRLSNFYNSHASKGIYSGGSNLVYGLNFNTETISSISITGVQNRNGVNSSTKLYGIRTNTTNSVPAFNFVTETYSNLVITNPSVTTGGSGGTSCNSSTNGYAYFDAQNNNTLPALPTNKTNTLKLSFSAETFSISGSTTGCLFVNYGSSQSTTKGYTGGYGYWTGDLFTPVDNVVNSIMGLVFSSDTASSIGQNLPGTTRFLTGTGNSTLKSYFYGGATGIQSSTPQNIITAMPFSTETPSNLSATIATGNIGNASLGTAICSSVKNFFTVSGTSWNTLSYATDTISSYTGTATIGAEAGQPYNIMP